MSNALHFAKSFADIVADMSDPHEEVRIVFDQYVTGSLKETTRQKRTIKQNQFIIMLMITPK